MKKKKHIKRYFTLLKGVKLPWLLILASFAFSLATTNAELQTATMTADIIDTSQNAINGRLLGSYILVAALAAVFTIASNYFTRKMEETITLRVRVKLFSKILRLPLRCYDADSGDGLVTRVTSDASAPASLFSMAVSFAVCVFTTVRAFVQLFAFNRTLAAYSLAIIPLTLLVSVFYSRLTFRLGVYSTRVMAGSLSYLAERVRNFRLIKSAAAEQLEAAKGGASFGRMYRAEFLTWLLVAGYQLASSLFSILFIIIVFVIGGQLLPSGAVTIGDLTSFYMVSGIATMQLMQFFMNVGSVAGTFGTMQKISEIIDTDAEPEDGRDVPQLCTDLVLDHVSFAYPGGEDVLRDVSLRIPAGKVTAVIGGNGAGKSTLFKLLTRLYEPTAGEIRFGDENIAGFALSAWRDRFAYVFQRDPLIGGTVRENITYGLSRAVDEETLRRAAEEANCCACILEKPDGFDEDVGLGGSNFSGGQGQCISIARAMLRDADYLLLDEATSNLDVVSEVQVTGALDRLMSNRTTLLIAHNYAAARNADYIVVMKDGAVEAAGTPAELAETNEYYQLFCKTI